MTLDKLKVAARQLEQREEWNSAIALYRKAIRAAEAAGEGADPALHNRIGDLAHKAGQDGDACDAWEQAAVRYGDQGFVNNAIALCAKILRVDGTRIATHLLLARFHARKRVIFDVQRHLTAYRDEMARCGAGADATTALHHFGAEFKFWPELQVFLDELLGREAGPSAQAADDRHVEGGSGLVFLDIEPGRNAMPPRGDATDAPLTLEPTALSEVDSPEAAVTPRMDGLESTVSVVPEAELPTAPAPLDFLEVTAPMPDVDAAASAAWATAPIDALGYRLRAQARLAHGDRSGGIADLLQALAGHVEAEEWHHAWQVAGELVEAEPTVITRHQARVELAVRMRHPGRLLEAYFALGEALTAEGSVEKAIAVYRRVLEIDDENVLARTALERMPLAPAAPSAPEDFIDLGAMLIDAAPRSTRMLTETTAIPTDENEGFREALTEFKRAIDQHLPVEDYQSHYDLGIAFREMGLLTEAINEFQKALRAPEGRLRTSEALGQVFFEQDRPAVAEAVLRSVMTGEENDVDRVGVLYWLGRSLEVQGRVSEARGCFERVLAVDVGFRDVADRLHVLGSGGAA